MFLPLELIRLDPLLYDPPDELLDKLLDELLDKLLDERLEPPFASYFLISALEAVRYQAGLPRSPKAPSEQPETMAVKIANMISLNFITMTPAYNDMG